MLCLPSDTSSSQGFPTGSVAQKERAEVSTLASSLSCLDEMSFIKKPSFQVNSSRSGTSIHTSQWKDSVQLVISSATDGGSSKTEKLALTRLPTSFDLKSTSTIVELPNEKSDLIKLVIHKGPKHWCDVTESANERLPAVVWRDPKDLKRQIDTMTATRVENKPKRIKAPTTDEDEAIIEQDNVEL